jgi:hypothetical protein
VTQPDPGGRIMTGKVAIITGEILHIDGGQIAGR